MHFGAEDEVGIGRDEKKFKKSDNFILILLSLTIKVCTCEKKKQRYEGRNEASNLQKYIVCYEIGVLQTVAIHHPKDFWLHRKHGLTTQLPQLFTHFSSFFSTLAKLLVN